MVEPTPAAPPDLLRRLAVAAWGVACGVLFATAATAAIIAVRGDTQDRPHPALLHSEYLKAFELVPWQERYERTWYALVCAGGALGGWAATRFARVSPRLAVPAVLAFVPVAAWACRDVFAAELGVGRLLACAAILAVPVLWRSQCPLTRSLRSLPSPRSRGEGEDQTLAPLRGEGGGASPPGEGGNCSPHRIWLTAALLCLPLAALLYGVLGPHHVRTVASECNTELHVASYIVGPALYYRAPGVVPGLDFESHYGIGHAYAFSLVMGGSGLEKALERYVLFVLAVSVLYFLSALLVLTDWLRNPWAALGVTLLVVFVTCEGLAYNYASNWPLRYPFLFAFLFAAVRGASHRWWCAAAGAVAGLSLFWQTDIGLYTLAAGVALYCANWLFLGGPAWRPVVFLAAAVGFFFALCTVLFGPRVLSVTFVARLLEPLLLYATGFGNQVMNWAPGWGYWYNLLGPGLAVASVAVLIGYGRRGAVPPRAVLYGAVASLVGLAMLFKWVNRSIDIVWSLNGGLVVAVAGWWLWLAWRALAARLADARPFLGFARQAGAAALIVALVVAGVRRDGRVAKSNYQGGSSSPIVRAFTWLDTFRNPINGVRKGIRRNVHPPVIDAAAVGYLHDHTRKTERVAVISGADWNYLAAAGRAPRLYWLQLFLVHSPVLLDRCAEDLRNSERVFVDRDALAALKGVNPAAHDAVAPILAEQFELADRSATRWDVYRRKPGATAAVK
jgi:hypothetical protein